MFSAGTDLHALLITPDGQKSWYQLKLLSSLGVDGGASFIWDVEPKTQPHLVAKLYNEDYRKKIDANDDQAARLIPLVQYREQLARDLPFCAWPRRLLLRQPKVTQSFATDLLGFTMAKLERTVSLSSLLLSKSNQLHLNPSNVVYIAVTLCEQIQKLHEHPWRFVFGDLSPNNVHFSHDFKNVIFIDTDGYQFQFTKKGHTSKFKAIAFTPSYNSPQSLAGQPISAGHDHFLLAILLFQIVMLARGLAGVHPYDSAGSETFEDLLEQRIFPFADPKKHKVAKRSAEAFQSLPQNMRDLFLKAFQALTPPTPADWIRCLNLDRRWVR